MKWKRLFILITALSIFSTVTIAADDVWESYKAKKMKVTWNGKEIAPSAVQLADGKKMLPASEISNSVQALVKFDESTDTLHMYKPNVHIFLQQIIRDEVKPFGNVAKGKYEFSIFSQVDNLLTPVHSFMITVEDPYGEIVYHTENVLEEQKDNFWFVTPTIKLDFKYTGKYKVKYAMKISEDASYQTVAEKVIRCFDTN